MLPNFLGIGANRAGSTWIYQNLWRHQDIFMPRRKELHFFDKEYDRGLAYYARYFADWSGEAAVGEITPRYLYSGDIAKRIHEDLPGVKLFVSLRNPADRVYSQYWRMVATSDIDDEVTFEEALRTKKTLLSDGCYFEHLSPYYDRFEPERISAILFDLIVKEPETVLSNLLNFLEVDPEIVGEFTTEPINSAASMQNLARSKSLWYVQKLLNRFKLNALRFGIQRINKVDLPSMKIETRQMLNEYYYDDILRTQDLVGVDLGSWLAEMNI